MPQPNLRACNAVIRSLCIDARHGEALAFFHNHLRSSSCFEHDHQVLAAFFKSCATLLARKLGRSLHGYVVKQGLLSSQVISKALLNMYAKCSMLDDSEKLFNEVGREDPVVWNIILSGFSGSRKYDVEVMRLFQAMHIGGEAKPTSVTIATVLPVCTRLGDLVAGRCVHCYVIKYGLEMETLVGNALVSMYAKSGLVCSDAYAVFCSMVHKDVVSWNAMIAGFAENKFQGAALQLFSLMVKGTIKPNYATIASILPVCASLNAKDVAYSPGREIHCYVLLQTELSTDVSVCNALISFYSKVGWTKEAEYLFWRMDARDLISWNSIISGYVLVGEWWKALTLFIKLLSLEVEPDSVTLVTILPACANLRNLQVGRKIHAYVIRHPSLLEDTAVGNALLNFYSKIGHLKEAFQTFYMISRRDIISWNSMIDACGESQNSTKFLELLDMMERENIRPDSVTMLAIIRYCATVLSMEKVKEVHGYSLKSGLYFGNTEPTIGNALLDAYAKCANMEYACRIFRSLAEKRNLVTCNSLISGYVSLGSHNDARTIFSQLSETDLTTWNLMVRVYAENDCPDQALSLFYALQTLGMKPDSMTIMSFLPACTQIASVHLLRQCHGYSVRSCFEDIHLSAAFTDSYSKCGRIVCAYKLFQMTTDKDLVMFTAMISGFAMHGMGEEALGIFSHMLGLGVKPDHVIFTSVLSACSHAGLVNEGLRIFYSIENNFGSKPTTEQYACAVDLLARGGRISDAYSLVAKMPVEANANVWGSLLGACKTHNEVDLGRIVADQLFKIEANNIGNYVVMSNLYASDARWDGVMEIRNLMRTRDLKKPAGCSWIEVEGLKNIFVAGDSSHRQRCIIYSTLMTLDQQIKEPV